MKKGLYLLFLVSYTLVSQTTITKNIGDFSTLKVYNGIDIELVKSDVPKIVITGEAPNNVVVKNTRDIFKIYLKLHKVFSQKQVKVTLYYTSKIKVIDANEGAVITAKNFKQSQLEVKSQEGALISMLVDVKYLTVKSVTGGIVRLSGTTMDQNIKVNNSGIYSGYKMKTKGSSVVRASLGGKAEVNVGHTLDAKVSFGGTIFYNGNPEVLKTKKVLGGTIEAKN